MAEQKTVSEPLYKKVWRPVLAFAYVAICLVDFLIMPMIIEISDEKESYSDVVTLSLKYEDAGNRIRAFERMTEKRSWAPVTLQGGAFFHIAFGALLTGAAVTRGMANRDSIQNGTHPV